MGQRPYSEANICHEISCISWNLNLHHCVQNSLTITSILRQLPRLLNLILYHPFQYYATIYTYVFQVASSFLQASPP